MSRLTSAATPLFGIKAVLWLEKLDNWHDVTGAPVSVLARKPPDIRNTPGRRPALRHKELSLKNAPAPKAFGAGFVRYDLPRTLSPFDSLPQPARAVGSLFAAAGGARFLDGLFDRFAGFARALLNPANQFFLLAFGELQIAVRELGPFLFQLVAREPEFQPRAADSIFTGEPWTRWQPGRFRHLPRRHDCPAGFARAWGPACPGGTPAAW